MKIGEIIALNEILQIIFLGVLSGISVFFIIFLLRQRSQLLKLQGQLVQKEKPQDKETETEEFVSEPVMQNRRVEKRNHDEFSESLGIIKELQSKLDGMTIELKIRGEMIIERDNKISELEKKVYDLDAQVVIFKEQIAPVLEQTITHLRKQQENLQEVIDKQKLELQDKEERITASKNILKQAGMGKLLELEEYQISLNKKDIIINEQIDEIKELQEQVDQLPVICLRMTEEIKNRESEIHSLQVYNKVLNKKLLTVQQGLNRKTNESDTSITDLSKTIMDLQDNLQEEKSRTTLLDKEILLLNSLILEKESKNSKLEEKLQNLLFK